MSEDLNDDQLEWDLEERDRFMDEFGHLDDIEPETETLVETDE